MTTCKTIAETIAAQMVAARVRFFYGTKADQNLKADLFNSADYDMCLFLDPVIKTSVATLNNVDTWRCPFFLTFAYRHAIDATPDQKEAKQQLAELASREYWLRMQAYEDATLINRAISPKVLTPFENMFDLHLCGVVLQTTLTLNDTGSVCIP